MRVLLSGGKKTQNIIDGISKRFTTSGDEFLVIEYLEDIIGIFSRGDYFDKAVITEQSITRDGAITDEMQLRSRVNEFASNMASRSHKYNYVFLAQTEEIANIIYEESLPISDESAVVYKKPRYNVTFFVDLIVTEAKDLPSDWVYVPELSIPESEMFNIGKESESTNTEDVIDTSDMNIGMELQDMPTDDLFSGDWNNIDGSNNDNGLNFDLGDIGQENSFNLDEEGGGFTIDENGNLIEDSDDSTQGFGNQYGGGFDDTDTDGVELSENDLIPDNSDGTGFYNNGNFGESDFTSDENDSSSFDINGDTGFSNEGDFNTELGNDNFGLDSNNGFDDFNNNNYSNSFENDEIIDTDNTEAIKQSGSLPDYREPVDNTFETSENDSLMGGIGLAAGAMTGAAMNNTSDIFGQEGQLDEEQYNYDETDGGNQMNNDGFSNNQYGNGMNNGFDNDGYANDDYANDDFTNNNGFGDEGFSNNSFDDDMGYNDGFSDPTQGSNVSVNIGKNTNNLDDSMYGNSDAGFDNSMYTNNDMYQNNEQYDTAGYGGVDYGNEQDNYQNNIENNMYGNPTGFEQSMYDDAAAMAAGAAIDAAMQQNNQLPNQTMQVSPKKGLKGIFGKKKGTAQYQNAASQLNAPQPVQGWQQEVQTQQVNTGRHRGVDINTIKQQLKPFASRGNSIVVTGCGGCGTSTIAYNLANIVHQLGYSVLLVDMDTEGRTQSYISKTNYDSMEPDGANLMSAVNSSTGTSAQEAIVKQGFHLLTMGLGTDTAQVNELLHKEKISRFANLVKSSHDFVIYDIPFKSATDYLSEITYTADNLVLVADASNWGITKLMLNVCNISADDMQDTIFNRAQLVFNKYRNLTKVFGRKVRTGIDITKIIDMKVQELIGEDPGFHFEDLHIAGILNDDPDFEQSWFEMVQYSDTQKGQAIFLELLEHIVLKK